jgi:DNA polymerase-4
MPLIRERGLTLIGIALSNLDDADAVQLTLPFDRSALASLDAALDELRERFGAGAVKRVAGLGRELGPAMPVLAD